MKLFSIPEYGRIKRSELGEKLIYRLQIFDERWSNTGEGCVFDWSSIHYIKAQNYVGVIQVPGLLVEILPKIDTSATGTDKPYRKADSQRNLAQSNLLYMLSFANRISVRNKDLASLNVQRLPLLEALVMIFIKHLIEELLKGIDSAYQVAEENSLYVKGKLLINEHIRRNYAHSERVFVRFDEFISDTWMNSILKSACYKLLGMVRFAKTQLLLQEATLYLSGVSNWRIEKYHFEKVLFNRNNERFSTLIEFCRMIFSNSTPAPSPGMMNTFSLLFPMEVLFEEFIAQFIRRNCNAFNLSRNMIYIQSRGKKVYLLSTEDRKNKFQLIPDIFINDACNNRKVIIDTKWKRIVGNSESWKNGVSQADLYQLYAYAKQYESPDNVLLYPYMDKSIPKAYSIFGDTGKKLRIEFVNLNRNLLKKKAQLKDDLQRVIWGNVGA